MQRTISWRIAALGGALFLLTPPRVGADLIKLKNGGEVRGRIVPSRSADAEATITVEALTGAVVVVARDEVQFLTRRSPKVEEYETRSKIVPDTVADRWDLAEWCRENGLNEQRAEQLERILELDPEHEGAHHALGHALRDGQWLTRDELMTSQGYVKHKGKYITPQELELLEKSAAELEAEREWFRKVRLWSGWLTGRSAQRSSEALAELKSIRDPYAVAALVHHFQDSDNKPVRELYVQILAQIPGDKPVPPLVKQSLMDVDVEIRSAALEGISLPRRAAAVPFYEHELKNGLNIIVRRAAAALERFGTEQSAPALIEALLTTHRYRVRVPDHSKTMSFSTDGSFGNTGSGLPPEIEAMLRAGQLPHGVIVNQLNPAVQPMKTITINYEHQNPEVLSALRKLTGENFGYDERTWKLWWNAKKNSLGSK